MMPTNDSVVREFTHRLALCKKRVIRAERLLEMVLMTEELNDMTVVQAIKEFLGEI